MTDLNELLRVDNAVRDEKWETDFFAELAHTNLNIISEEPQVGPDGWPYLFVQTDENGTEPAAKVLDWLHDKGIGLAVNPDREAPDYVFTFGMLWNYKERGQFLTPFDPQRGGQVKIEEGEKIHAGAPNEAFLPEYSRKILREFLRQQGVEAKVLMIGRLSRAEAAVPGATAKHYDLCFSIESLKNPPAEEHRGIMEAISWFLPAHYSLMIASEKGLPPFHPL